jgi:N-acetylglucosaminyldiphosphoundecaprenol N-acetyl-beta-D-mannosaminyltransferase
MLFNKIIKNESEVINIVIDSLSSNQKLLLTYLNQHCFNIYYSNSEYKNLLDNSFTVFLDGFGVFAALKFLGYKNMQKCNATDLYAKLFQHFSENKTEIFLLGGNFTDKLISQMTREKKLTISGYQNGYFKNEELDSTTERIMKISPDVLIIGAGVPKQEIIAARITDSIKNITILCVGNFLEFYFGTKKRAPKILRLSGLEWLHRLLTEPARLWKRYVIGIPYFFYLILKYKFK